MIKTRVSTSASESYRMAALAQKQCGWLSNLIMLSDISDRSIQSVEEQIVNLIVTLEYFTDIVVLRKNSPFGILNQVWFEVLVYNADENPVTKHSWIAIFEVSSS